MTQLPAVTGYKKVPLIRPPRRSNSALGKSRILRDNINAMEYPPDTTALCIPTSHTSLPFDVEQTSGTLGHISQASDHLEHIAVSYAISASDFFDHCKEVEVEFKEIKTLALTYRFDGVPGHALLITAAEAAKRMPALEMLEIWEYDIPRLGGAFAEREADIFGYKKLDPGKGRITWTSSGNHRLPTCVRNAWKNVLTGGQSRTLEVKEHHLPQDLRMKLTKIFPHLMLKEQILRDVSRKRALILDM